MPFPTLANTEIDKNESDGIIQTLKLSRDEDTPADKLPRELPETDIIKQGDCIARKWYFWCMLNHSAMTNFIMAYNMGLFNTLSNHMVYIYGWTNEEKTLHYSLINSLPMAVAAIFCLFAGKLADKYGRRRLLMCSYWLAILGNGLTLIANTGTLHAGRLIIGMCYGIWTSVGSLYQIEIAPKEYKGTSGIIFSLFFGFGIFLTFILGYGLPSNEADSATNSYWRVMLGTPIILNLLVNIGFLLFFREESPPFLFLKRNDEKKTREVLALSLNINSVNREMNDFKEFQENNKSADIGWKQLFSSVYMSRLVLITLFTLGYSYVGSNAINVYSKDIIEKSADESTAQLFTTIMPAGDIIGPFFAYFLIGWAGRKLLFLFGLVGCQLTMLGFCITGWLHYYPLQRYLILLFKLVFSSSVAPVHWIYPSEILPPVGMGFFGFAYWTLSVSTVATLPTMLDNVGSENTIIIFPIVTAIILVFLIFNMHETSGKSKQQIELMFQKRGKLQQSQNGMLADNDKNNQAISTKTHVVETYHEEQDKLQSEKKV